jgi:hypothetical protein
MFSIFSSICVQTVFFRFKEVTKGHTFTQQKLNLTSHILIFWSWREERGVCPEWLQALPEFHLFSINGDYYYYYYY